MSRRARSSSLSGAVAVAVLRSAFAAGAALLALTACSSSAGHSASSSSSSSSSTLPRVSAIAWSALHNPVYGLPDHAVKDPALVAVNGGWVLLFSEVNTHGAWRIGIARSPDLTKWTPVPSLPRDPETEGEASPDVVREPDGKFVVTYQSFVHDRDGAQPKLYARTTADFTTFSPPTRLLANVLAARRGPAHRSRARVLARGPAARLQGGHDGCRLGAALRARPVDDRGPRGTLDGDRPARHLGLRGHRRELRVPRPRWQTRTPGDEQPARPSSALPARGRAPVAPRVGCTGRRHASSSSPRSPGIQGTASPARTSSTRTVRSWSGAVHGSAAIRTWSTATPRHSPPSVVPAPRSSDWPAAPT